MKRAKYSTRPFPHPVLLAVLPAALALQWAASRSPEAVERFYAKALYPQVAPPLAAATGVVPFSVGEVLIGAAIAAAVWWLVRAVRRVRAAKGRRWRALAGAAARAAGAVGLVYMAFLLLWGLNYHRPPLAVITGLGQGTTAVSLDELEALCGELVSATNEARAVVSEDGRGVGRVEGGVPGTLRRAMDALRAATVPYAAVAGPFARPKPFLLSTALSYLGISGIYLPFTAEANVNRILPDSQLPFTAAHELAHQGGIAPEDEANFVAYVACLRHPDADFRYSGAFNAALYALSALSQADGERARRQSTWSPAVRRDLAALAEWNERYRGPAETAARAVNDAYLKSQGVPEGVRSYGRMVDLLVLERRRAKRDGAREGGSGGIARAIEDGMGVGPSRSPRDDARRRAKRDGAREGGSGGIARAGVMANAARSAPRQP